ncbi:MAG: nucleosidase [Alphaproteobacteria bacterium]|nr:nucleosidase [Alphaproteobacteria bacterium]
MKPLLVFALPQESQDVFVGYDVLYTGVGKVNAAYALTRRLHQGKPGVVINLGTAGSARHKSGSVVNPTAFIQRDMDVTALGFEKFQTPFSKDPILLKTGQRVPHFPDGVCGSGDNFAAVVSAPVDYDVIDMEAHALALVCQREGVPFLSLKYISDGADESAATDWNAALHHTAEVLLAALQKCGY